MDKEIKYVYTFADSVDDMNIFRKYGNRPQKFYPGL